MHAYLRYRKRIRKDFDVVIDEVNTIPFFTPLWAGIPSFVLIHQLAREVWWYESSWPLSLFGYVAEPIYLRCYRTAPTFTISQSTKTDLRRLGFNGPITILPIGVEVVSRPPSAKADLPTFLYVGRLAPSKRIKDIIEAFGIFRRHVSPAMLWLIGEGPKSYQRELYELTARLGLSSDVNFLGRVSRADKHQRMAEAQVLLMTSVREGWGLVVTEANAVGTPAIVYDVGGLRDAVQHEVTGLVVAPKPAELAKAMLRLAQDPALYRQLSTEAIRTSALMSFDTSAALLRNTISSFLACREAKERPPARAPWMGNR